MKLIKIQVKEVKIGDILNINTGYRPLDDENCEVLKIENRIGLFGDKLISFFIKSHGGNHWTDFDLDDFCYLTNE